MSVVLDTPEQIAAFQALRVRRALKLDAEHGIGQRGGSIMKLAASYCGSSKRTKKGVYRDYDAWMVAAGFDSVPLKEDAEAAALKAAQKAAKVQDKA